MPRLALSIALATALSPLLAPSVAAQCEIQKFSGSGLVSLDAFGWSISRSGDTMFIGAIGDDTFASESGAVYVFERVGGDWTQVQKLTNNTSGTMSQFGNTVSVVGDHAVIGAHMNGTGRVYHYTRSGGVWSFLEELSAPGLGPMFHFGHHVMIAPDGQTAVVGTMRDDHAGFEAGSAHVFVLSGGSFVHADKLTASDAATPARFGRTVAIDGDRIAIGAHKHNSEQGAVYIFERDDSGTPLDPLDDQWNEVQKLEASDGEAFDHFGLGLSMDGDRLAIGAETDVQSGTSSGSVYVFDRVGGTWVETQKVTPNDGVDGDGYGISTYLDGTRLLVGAKGRDEGATETGAIYVYERIAGFYLHATKLIASDASNFWRHGDEVSLDMDGDLVHSTAWGVTANQGAAYTFRLPRLYCEGKLNTAGCVPVISYNGQGASSTSAGSFLVTAALILNNQVGILIYGTNGEASIPFQGGTLCIGSPILRTAGQFSGGVGPTGNCTGKFQLNFNAVIQAGLDPNLQPGATVNAQYWYRDPTHPVGGSGLSNGIEFEICD